MREEVQRARKGFVNLAKQDPGWAKQNSQATAGTNFTKPRTSHIFGLCSYAKLALFMDSAVVLKVTKIFTCCEFFI